MPLPLHTPHLFTIYKFRQSRHRYIDLGFVGLVIAASPIGPVFNNKFRHEDGSPKYVMHYEGPLPEDWKEPINPEDIGFKRRLTIVNSD